MLCDIPGLIEGAAQGTGLGFSFLRHVQRCKVLLHVVDGTSDDPVGDFKVLNKELADYDDLLAKKPQVVVLNMRRERGAGKSGRASGEAPGGGGALEGHDDIGRDAGQRPRADGPA